MIIKQNTMTNFKVGDKIKMKEDCKLLKKGEVYYIDIIKDITETKTFELYVSNEDGIYCTHQHHWQPLEKTLEDLEVGDYVVDRCGEKYKILDVRGAVGNRIYDITCSEEQNPNWEKMFGFTATAFTLIQSTYSVYQPQTPKKMTVKEICDKLGEEIEIIKE